MSSESVKVCDLELEKLAELAKCWDDIETVLAKYVEIMESVHKDTVKAGHIHESLDLLRFYAEKYNTYAGGLGGNASRKAIQFVDKIEDIDLNLYNEV